MSSTASLDASPNPARPVRPLTESGIFVRRTVAHWAAQPAPFVVNLLFPVFVLLMMGGLFGGAIAGSVGNYLPFAVPGVFAVTMLFGLETTMAAITTDATAAVTDRLRTLPISALSLPLGRAIADMLASVLGLAVMVAAGLAMGWRTDTGTWSAGGAFALLLWLRFGLLWLGMWAGVRARGPETVVTVQILVWPVTMLSTVFLDPSTMPYWLGVIAEWNPLSATASASRELFGNPGIVGLTWATDHALLAATLWPLILVAVFAPLTARAYRGMSR